MGISLYPQYKSDMQQYYNAQVDALRLHPEWQPEENQPTGATATPTA